MKKKLVKLWRDIVSNKKYSKTLAQVLDDDFMFMAYRNQGVYALISRVSFLSQFLGRKRVSEIYLRLSNLIKEEDIADRLLLVQLALSYHSSEKNRRAYAWCCLKSEMYSECYSQIRNLESFYSVREGVDFQKRSIASLKSSLVNRIGLSKYNEIEEQYIHKDEYTIQSLVVAPDLKSEQAIELFIKKNFKKNNIDKFLKAIYTLDQDDIYKATLLVKVAKYLRLESGDSEVAIFLAEKAVEICPTEAIARAAYWIGRHLGAREFCLECLSIIKIEKEKNPKNKLFFNSYSKLKRDYHNTFSELEVLSLLDDIRVDENYIPIKGKVCYILHNSFPYSSGGYATRGHGLLLGLKEQGLDIEVINRPGFPYDIKDDVEPHSLPLLSIEDGVNYHLIENPQRRGITSFEYMAQSVDALIDKFKEIRPSLIMAASNYLTAFPAMIAAKKLGIPFIYEVRGFWEITRLSREPEFAKSPRFANQRRLETEVANHADHVFTLTSAMRDELKKRGVKTEITLLPNSCNPEHFNPRGKDLSLLKKLNIPESILVIGYIGTFVIYEGLEDLASACAILKKQGLEFRLLIVGNENATGLDRGPITQQIYEIAEQNGFADWLIMPGRVPYEEVEAYYSLIDIAPFPRKPWPVCEMVSPMKPLEALAMEKTVIVSSVHALVEMITDRQTGRVFDKGNPESLAKVLEELLLVDDLSVLAYGANGREWVLKNRTWEKTANIAVESLERFL
ncbi:hypothetical protein DC083_03420 [Ignatzschineria ureiclastica]|uniref:Glycosyltransferase subfamily 4-like N-terminal domain-containing protein n=1 Tax=Ignatzschineria ureiclastica TaxID=472582 RepID=A0A2U2AFU3_9GAMM|nr:glycosyltransferase family 4 protein [Ignatzschineria ureiclastica]PWD81510.1 hypothetical protein DC083_03420 [Ignatzschineria ureiclastica]GHA01195.1 hypothetical protein GCM10007162_16900 [Ignatzschineria ureiclastica]